MSSGAFQNAKYETDNGNIVAIKVQPETIACTIDSTANDEAAGTLTAGFPSAKVSGSRRTIGINARTVSIRLTAALSGYKADSILRIPALTPAFYTACSTGATGTYLGTACEVVGRSPESIK